MVIFAIYWVGVNFQTFGWRGKFHLRKFECAIYNTTISGFFKQLLERFRKRNKKIEIS